MRTCTGCRQTALQRELVRLVFDGSALIIDPGSLPGDPAAARRGASAASRRPGRGAYVHPRAACV